MGAVNIQGQAPFVRYCIQCGRAFGAWKPDANLCNKHRRQAIADQAAERRRFAGVEYECDNPECNMVGNITTNPKCLGCGERGRRLA